MMVEKVKDGHRVTITDGEWVHLVGKKSSYVVTSSKGNLAIKKNDRRE